MLREENDGSEHPTSSDPGHLVHQKRKLKMNVFEQRLNRVLNALIQVVKWLRKRVKERVQKLLTEGTRNDVAEERSLHLKFLDEVSGPVQTSKEFRAVKGGPLEVALFDAAGNIVNSGPESSAEVEILLIDASGNGKECATTNENFEGRIIKAGDKEKPHFAKNVYVNLENGVGSLINQKLGQDSKWTKNWTCRLGARFVKNFRGLKVQKAWTEPFEVRDNRGKLYKKHEPLFPDSEVWRVKGIGRDGEPRKRLEREQIKTELDLLFWLSVNPKGLQKITGAGDNKSKTIVAHVRTCKIDDKMMYCQKSSTEPHMGVIYDCVGELKGVINESHFVPIDNLSADEKVHACKLLSLVLEPSAFVERYKTFFDNEASLLQQYPYKSSNVNSSTNCSIKQWSNSIGSDYINSFQTAEPGCSSQSISPNIIYDSLESRDMGKICNHALVPIPDPENIPMDLDYEMYGVQRSTHSEILKVQSRNCLIEMTMSGGRSLQLRFSDEVSLPVLTGKILIGKTGNPMMVSLIDSTTGEVMDCEPESSAKVEMLLLDASDDDKGSNWSVEDFNNRIISEDDKGKPHLAKNEAKCIRLNKGVGNLCKLKLGHDSRWMKSCKCRLAARVVESFRGNEVKEALTESFVVSESRRTLYEKHHPPILLDEVWRLEKIGRDGKPRRRLNAKNIETVLDFLFWLSVNAKELQKEILVAGDSNWQTTVTHAQSSIIDDKRMFSHKSATEPQTAVVYDAIGKLKGLIDDSHFVPIDDLSAVKKDYAHKLLRSILEPSTFVERYKTFFDDEASLLQQFPYRSSENIHGHQTIGPASSSQSIIASHDIYDSGPSDSLASKETGELGDHSLFVFQDPENIDGDTPTDLDNENHFFRTDNADGREMLASFNDMYYPQQQLNGTIEMVGESSSRCSNTSFYSVNSTLMGESGGWWQCDDVNWWDRQPPSPNPMLHYADDITQMYGHIDESRADEGVAEPQATTNPPKGWRQWFSFREKMSPDVAGSSHKKPRVD